MGLNGILRKERLAVRLLFTYTFKDKEGKI